MHSVEGAVQPHDERGAVDCYVPVLENPVSALRWHEIGQVASDEQCRVAGDKTFREDQGSRRCVA